MKVLHLLVTGNLGGIESLVKNYAQFSSVDNYFLFAWQGGVNAEAIRRISGKVIVLDANSNFGRVSQILKLIRKEKIDVIVSHNSAPLFKIILIWVHYFMRGRVTIAYAHANAMSIYDESRKRGMHIRKFVHRIGFGKCDEVIAISKFVKESLIRSFNTPAEKIKVIYNGTMINKALLSEKNGNDIPQLIYVGRLKKEKGVQNILEALANMDHMVKYNMKIIGDGDYRPVLEALVSQLGLQDRVCFCGSRVDVTKDLMEADIFVHFPECEEGFGIAIIEAMSLGKICVCSESGAIKEIIKNQYNGYLIEKRDMVHASEILKRVISEYQSEKNDVLRGHAIESVQKYSIENYAEKFDETIETLYKRKIAKREYIRKL